MKQIKKIIIVNCYDYSGGPLVLSELCRCLNKLSYDARLLLLHTFPTSQNDLSSFSKWNLFITNIKLIIAIYLHKFFPSMNFDKKYFPEYFKAHHLKNCKIQINPFFSKKTTVVLYPEIIYGNPLRAQNIVRWLLYHNRYVKDQAAYEKNDMFICYRKIFNDITLNPAEKKVEINCFDKNLYRQTNFAKRFGKCFIIRKGQSRSDLPQKYDGIVVDSLPEEKKVEIFNQCEYCYCYDTQTFYSCIASICGCITIVVPEPGKNRNDYRRKDEGPHYGVAYGDSKEEIEWAQTTREKLINSLNYEDSNIKNTLHFIKYAKAFFIK